MKLPFELNKARKLSDEDIERIINLSKFGESESSIAKLLGVARSTVRHHRLKHLEPVKFAEMEHRKILRNKSYKSTNQGNTKDYRERLVKAHGKKVVLEHLSKIERKTRDKQKRLEWQRKYREKNKDRINALWRKNYHIKKLNK